MVAAVLETCPAHKGGGGEGAMPRNSTGYDLKSTEDSTLLKEETGQRRVGRRQPAGLWNGPGS